MRAGIKAGAQTDREALSRAIGLAAGADGVHVEVHNCPEEALSDGPQALLPEQYAALAKQMRELAELLGKQISPLPGVPT